MGFPLKCPDCGGGLIVRNSVGMHPLLRGEYIQCKNMACGSTFIGEREIKARLSPSASPNPSLELPLAPSAERVAARDFFLQTTQLDWVAQSQTEDETDE